MVSSCRRSVGGQTTASSRRLLNIGCGALLAAIALALLAPPGVMADAGSHGLPTGRAAKQAIADAIHKSVPGATNVVVTCHQPRRGSASCVVQFAASGQSCSDRHVTVTARRARLRVVGLRPACAAPPATATTSGGASAAPAVQPSQEQAPPAYKAAIGCANGAVNPPDCTVFAGGTSNQPYTNGNCVGNDGLVHLTLEFYYSNGWEWFRRVDGCNNWYDAQWSDPLYYQADFNAWDNRTFGPVVYCDYHRGGMCS